MSLPYNNISHILVKLKFVQKCPGADFPLRGMMFTGEIV